MLRLFIAIDLSPDVRRWLSDTRARLKSSLPADAIRWVNPEGIHATLKFLGEVPDSRVEAIRGAMHSATAGGKSFSVTVEELGCFPDSVRPRILWVGIRPEPILIDFQKKLEERLALAGFKKERRPFSPHLTLGRVRDGVTGSELHKIGKAVEGIPAGKGVGLEVNELTLFRSVLRPSGAEYSVVCRFPLNG